MKKLMMLLIPLLMLSGCTNDARSSVNQSSISDIQSSSIDEETVMNLEIDNQEINVSWLNNASVKAIEEIKPLEISMHRYGGFEQVGSLGQSIVSNDERITTEPGDIVLYSSNQIVVFFGSNTWEYTKLGHINLNDGELDNLLNKETISFKIK